MSVHLLHTLHNAIPASIDGGEMQEENSSSVAAEGLARKGFGDGSGCRPAEVRYVSHGFGHRKFGDGNSGHGSRRYGLTIGRAQSGPVCSRRPLNIAGSQHVRGIRLSDKYCGGSLASPVPVNNTSLPNQISIHSCSVWAVLIHKSQRTIFFSPAFFLPPKTITHNPAFCLITINTGQRDFSIVQATDRQRYSLLINLLQQPSLRSEYPALQARHPANAEIDRAPSSNFRSSI